MWYAYLFETKSIQSFLFSTGRLRDVIGGSELVDRLTGALLDRAVAALGLREGHEVHFSRRAGGAIYALFDEPQALRDFAALWGLLAQQYAPGLNFDIGSGEGDTPLAAFDAARKALRRDSSRAVAALPVAAPIAHRSRRTGNAAVEWDRREGAGIDAAARRSGEYADLRRSGLVERVCPPDSGLGSEHWPRNLDAGEEGDFPFRGEDRTVALVHADGNGLGQVLRNARQAAQRHPERFVTIFRALSDGIGRATEASIREAVAAVLLPERERRMQRDAADHMLAARPIVVGGDDVTFLVRADLALPFTAAFLSAFERHSREAMEALAGQGAEGLPPSLTACAGLVYTGASQPFHMAVELAEDLTKHAKRNAKAVGVEPAPGTVAFHRVTSAVIDDYREVREREHTAREGETAYVGTLGAYAVAPDQGLPALDDLIGLQRLFADARMPRGAARALFTLLGSDPSQARIRYRRWRQHMSESDRDHELLASFDRYMERMVPGYEQDADLPFGAARPLARGRERLSPLGDALALAAVGNESGLFESSDESSRRAA